MTLPGFLFTFTPTYSSPEDTLVIHPTLHTLKTLSLTLLGYGKMGKAIEQEALARGHRIAFCIDVHNAAEWAQVKPENTDVVIEFTHPNSFPDNLDRVMKAGIPMVTGTTGWHEGMETVRSQVAAQEGALMYSSNYSIGVNLLFKLNQQLARWMNDYPEYDCFIEEQHHRHKADAPSGTAISLARQVIDGLDRKSRIATDALLHRAPDADELSVGYVRSGEIVGRHKVSYTSEIDALTIEHHAYNRRGFAVGAVVAAEWLAGKKGLFEFIDIF